MQANHRRRLFSDRVQTIRKFYKSPKFALIDLTFGFISLFTNPYRVSRKFLQKRGAEEIHVYGETPPTTYQKIAHECQIGPNDTWIEMGAGRGKGCFWLSHFVRCRVIGIEWISQFVFYARLIKMIFRMSGVTIIKQDIATYPIPENATIYLYGLWPNIHFPKSAKIITVSEPLDGYQVLHSFWVRFPWGRTRVYLQKII